MKKLLQRLESMQRGGPQLVVALLGIGSAALLLFLGAIVGALTVDGGDDASQVVATGDTNTTTTLATDTTAPTETTVLQPGTPTSETTPTTTATKGKSGTTNTTAPGNTATTAPTSPTVTEAPAAPGDAPLPKGGNSTGVTASTISYGVHAPVTFNKAPVPLAGPVVRGIKAYLTYLNNQGGVNGRKIELVVADDEFTTGGAGRAADTLINDRKVFFIAGTLGVDQIQVVANEAKKAGVPYFAGGGHEPQFQDFGVHQILSSYDTHVIKLAQWMAKDPAYAGKKVGAFVSDTPLIHPVVTDLFRSELEKNGLSLVAVQKVQKPEFQSAQGYGAITLDFKSKGVQVVVPLTDPINTSGLVRQCQTEGGCPWTYSFSDFAHDGETALTLFNDQWGQLKVRGLSGGCYPNAPAAQINDPAKCASMGAAKAQFEAVRGAGSWTSTQSDSDGASTGYNSAAGYQWVGFWLKAMKDVGSEVTRERLVAAINRYDSYADLVTGPITYKNSPNVAHGAEKMAIWEAQTSNKYKMLSDGLVDGF